MIGVKGLAPGSAVQAMDKTKSPADGGHAGRALAARPPEPRLDPHIERTDITELMLTNDE